MKAYHGLISAYNAAPGLRELVSARIAASLPFCSRYRLVDFPLSSMKNAGIVNVGVIPQRDYQSLLDHIGSGKIWDMSRRSGGLRMLPPFGLPEYHRGDYSGAMEALNAVASYVRDIKEESVVLMRGNLCANVDLNKAIEVFEKSGAEITAVVSPNYNPSDNHHRFIVGEDGFVEDIDYNRTGAGRGFASLEVYIIKKATLLGMMDYCASRNLHNFHRDALAHFFAEGGKVSCYVHEGYATIIKTVDEYFKTSMDMLDSGIRHDVFNASRPVLAKPTARVSAFYSDLSCVKNSLVADGCVIEGELENCIVFAGAHIRKGAKLKNCIIFRGCDVGENARLENVIADKYVVVSPETQLVGNEKLPVVVPKGSKI